MPETHLTWIIHEDQGKSPKALSNKHPSDRLKKQSVF
jgi:hypothetical protein